MTDLPVPPDADGQLIDAEWNLLDRQVLDPDGRPVTVVDDVELAVDGGGPPVVRSLLAGPALFTRLFGGKAPPSRWLRIGWEHVAEVDVVVHIDVAGEELDLTWSERWVAEHVIGRIPGGRHDPE